MIAKLFLMSVVLVGFTTAFDIGNIRSFLTTIKDTRAAFDVNPCTGRTFAKNTRGCSWFWQCSDDGLPVRQDRCPEGRHFNYNDQTCDYKENANCQLDETVPKECPSGTGILTIPHPETCSKFTGK